MSTPFGAPITISNAFASLSIAGPSSSGAGPSRTTKAKSKLSGLDELARKIRPRIPDLAVLAATMVGIPTVQDAITGLEVVQDWTSIRAQLLDFQQNLERLVRAFELQNQQPGSMDPMIANFRNRVEALLDQVQRELGRTSSGSRLRNANKLVQLLNDYKQDATHVLEEAVIAGVISQQNVVLPEEYDSTIPILKSLHKGNGLVQKALVNAARIDGGPVEHAPVQNLHVTTFQGAYKDTLVEIKEYFGGPDNGLLETVKELVDQYQTFKDNPNLPQLYGGSVQRLPDGKLCAYLVFSPAEGEPWFNVAMAKQSVELLCQVAEQTMQAFDYLKIKKQMNWESIRIRPDGSLLIVPTTQGDKFLLTEDVWDLSNVPDDMPWPIKEFCELLREADRQGITRDAVAALRAHTGNWDKIAVWKVAKQIHLRPVEKDIQFFSYPPPNWCVHAGTIAWNAHQFETLDMMPRQGLTRYDRKHLRRVRFIHASGNVGGRMVDYLDSSENWLERTQDGEWERFSFEPWQGLKLITVHCETPRLDMVPWSQWKLILESCAGRRGRSYEELAVVTRTHATMTLEKRNCPELGTRPLYFYRKPNERTATPSEFWGFFSFNPDPAGPPGIHMRVSDRDMGRLASDSRPPERTGWEPNKVEVDFGVYLVDVCDDWEYKIREELEQNLLTPCAMFEKEEITWSDADEDMDDGW